MTAQQVSTVVTTITAAGTIAAYRAVAVDGTQAADGGGTGVVIMGIADNSAVQGDALKINRGPTAMAVAGAVIDGTENRLKTDAQGRLIPWTTGSVIAARLKPGQIATAAGDIVEVFPIYS